MKKALATILSLSMIMGASAAVPALADSTTNLEFFCVKEEVQDVLQEIVTDFEAANPGVNIEITCPTDGTTVLLTRISSNDVPDMMMVYPAESTYRAFYDGGYILDLAGYDFMNNMEQSVLDLASYNGVQIAIPYTLSTYGIYYNADIFSEVGIEVPTTMDELIAACAKLKEAGYDAFTLPLQNGQNQITERLLGAFDGSTYEQFQKLVDGEITVQDIGSIKALADTMLAIKPYSTEDAMGLNGDGATSDFVNGVAAMRFNGSWFLSSILNANPDANVGMFGIPSPVTGDTVIPVNIDTGFAVSANSADQETCLKFMEYLTQPEVAQKYYEVDGNINMVKGVTYDKTQLMDVYNAVMAGKMSLTQINLWGQNAPNVRSDLGSALQTVYMDEDMDEYYDLCNSAIVDNFVK